MILPLISLGAALAVDAVGGGDDPLLTRVLLGKQAEYTLVFENTPWPTDPAIWYATDPEVLRAMEFAMAGKLMLLLDTSAPIAETMTGHVIVTMWPGAAKADSRRHHPSGCGAGTRATG